MQSDHQPPHLDDARLNEYLDQALPPAAEAEARTHLAGCAACTARLEALRALFAEMEALPDAALGRDLAPAVVQAIRQRGAGARTTAPRPRWVPAVLAAQGAAALALAVVAWPWAAELVGGLSGVVLPPGAAAWHRDLLAAAQALTRALDAARWLESGWTALQTDWPAAAGRAGRALNATGWLAAAAGAGLVWLASHLWLLRSAGAHSLGRH